MIRPVLKKLQVIPIDVYVFRLQKANYKELTLPEYPIDTKVISYNKTTYRFLNKDQVIHRSTLFKSVFLLRLLNKKGPVIGDCFTNTNYRGLSLYPKMIHYIAKINLFEKNLNELFIIVDTTNAASIRGIEKAGFIKYAQITTKRWLLFYFNRTINYSENV
jgi:hypothetical protein